MFAFDIVVQTLAYQQTSTDAPFKFMHSSNLARQSRTACFADILPWCMQRELISPNRSGSLLDVIYEGFAKVSGHSDTQRPTSSRATTRLGGVGKLRCLPVPSQGLRAGPGCAYPARYYVHQRPREATLPRHVCTHRGSNCNRVVSSPVFLIDISVLPHL